MKRCLAATWDILAIAGTVRSVLGVVALAVSPGVVYHVNRADVPLWQQEVSSLVLLLVAVVTWGRNPVRRSWATLWAVGAGEFATPAISLAGWEAPSLMASLWLLVPVALVLPTLVAHRRSLATGPHLAWTRYAELGLGAVVLVLLLNLESTTTALRAAVWTTITMSAMCSALALRRRKPRHGTA